jgi:regulator of sigma E protease
MAVERAGELVDLGAVKVSGDGRVGFSIESTARTSARIARWPASAGDPPSGDAPPSFAALGVPPGSTILSIDGRPVGSLSDAREALRAALDGAPAGAGTVALQYRPAVAGAGPRSVQWTLSPADREALARLSWLTPVSAGLFEPETKLLRGDSPASALALGVRETHRVMVQTYLTFARLFQGSVKIEHLKGPVGIAHVGTLIADKGTVWLLFFMAVISVNLAVINFLPLPIVDGGHLLFLIWEHFTGRPVSVVVQNVATLAGLAMIGTIFLIVTYNDIARLITGG